MKSSNTDPVSPLDYCKMGWPIIPVRRNKRPFLLDWPNRGSTDQHEISSWVKTYRDCNWGVLPSKCGLAVVDIDPRNGGEASWSRILSTAGPVSIETPRVTTGGGGFHLYFEALEDEISSTTIAPGVDLKARSGYVIVPPSIHASGKPYEWVISPFDNGLQPFPQFLLNALSQGHKGDTSKIGDQILEGARNSTLFRYAGRLLNQGLDDDEILAILIRTNESRCKPPLPESEIHQLVKNILRYRNNVTLFSQYHNTDLGNVKRLLSLHGDDLRYLSDRGKWLIWDGKHWKEDGDQEIFRRIEDTLRAMHLEADNLDDQEKRARNMSWVLQSESRSKISAMEEMAQNQVPVVSTDLDSDPMLLNVANGTINLISGTLQNHDRANLITKALNVEYEPDAACPTWLGFMRDVTNGDGELHRFLQRAVGYSLTGKTDEHCLFFLYGTGANGKTTFIEAIQWLLRDYALKVNTDALLDPNRSGGTASPHIASLTGVRLAIGSEIPQEKRLNEALIKDITGGDTISARFLYCNPFSFQPTHKIWLYGNHKPRIRGDNIGIWRRIRIIPFQVTIPPGERRPMSELLAEFRKEASGILNWAVEGCLDWKREGLGVSAAVSEATASYRTEEDSLQRFLDDCCVIDPSWRAEKKMLFQCFQEWVRSGNELDLCDWSQKKFSRRLAGKGIETGGHARKEYLGVRIRSGGENVDAGAI